MPAIFSTAPGKAILFGEHAVVYGQPAIAIPVTQLKAKAVVQALPLAKTGTIHIEAPDINLDSDLSQLPQTNPHAMAIQLVLDTFNIDKPPSFLLRITSKIPVASGLGSGAAVAVATIRALSNFLGQPLEDDQVCSLAFEIEKLHHGTPSGIDNTVITYAKPVYFIKGQPIEILSPTKSFTILIADTGVSKATSETIAQVHAAWRANPSEYEVIFNNIGEISKTAYSAINAGKLKLLGQLMDQNQNQLSEMDLSSPELDKLIQSAKKAGALGAKLSGGGQGGNMLALVDESNRASVQSALKNAGAASVFSTTIP